MSVEYDSLGDYFTVTLDGPLSADLVREQFEILVAHPNARPSMNILWDLRSADLTDLTPNDLRRLLSWIDEHAARSEGGRTAIVAARDVDYGVARMYELHAARQLHEIRVLRDLAEATGWVRRARPGA